MKGELSRRQLLWCLMATGISPDAEATRATSLEAMRRYCVDRLFVYTIKDGKLHECWAYDVGQATVDWFFR